MRRKWVRTRKEASVSSQHIMNTANVRGHHCDYRNTWCRSEEATSTLPLEAQLSREKYTSQLRSASTHPTGCCWRPRVPTSPKPDSQPLSNPCNPPINSLLKWTRVTFCFLQLKSPSDATLLSLCFLPIPSADTLRIYQVPPAMLGIRV